MAPPETRSRKRRASPDDSSTPNARLRETNTTTIITYEKAVVDIKEYISEHIAENPGDDANSEMQSILNDPKREGELFTNVSVINVVGDAGFKFSPYVTENGETKVTQENLDGPPQ
jgi:hypothetical protein